MALAGQLGSSVPNMAAQSKWLFVRRSSSPVPKWQLNTTASLGAIQTSASKDWVHGAADELGGERGDKFLKLMGAHKAGEKRERPLETDPSEPQNT